jgi:hemerythrin-like domain-containing protein
VIISDHPHEAILDAARAAGCDLVFMATHGRRGLQGALLGSVTRKVLQHTTLAVLVASVESNQAAQSDEQRALAILRDEHRSLAAVLHALLRLVDDTTGTGDPALTRAMLFYVEQFPERLHHPKEDAWLFRKLRERTSECDGLLTALEQQHIAGAKHFAELSRTLQAGDRAAFRQGVHDFAQMQWRHMRTEEGLVLPAASRHLQPADWHAIADAFETNADPRFGTGESFDNLASRLLELAGRH